MSWNNFRESCIRKLKHLPKKPCPKGQTNFNQKNNLQHKDKLCPWYINDEKYNYCFWKYVNDASDDKGQMPILCYREIGEFLGLSSSTVGITVRDCLEKLKEIPECKEIRDLMLHLNRAGDSNPEYEKALKDSDKIEFDE